MYWFVFREVFFGLIVFCVEEMVWRFWVCKFGLVEVLFLGWQFLRFLFMVFYFLQGKFVYLRFTVRSCFLRSWCLIRYQERVGFGLRVLSIASCRRSIRLLFRFMIAARGFGRRFGRSRISECFGRVFRFFSFLFIIFFIRCFLDTCYLLVILLCFRLFRCLLVFQVFVDISIGYFLYVEFFIFLFYLKIYLFYYQDRVQVLFLGIFF